MTVLYDYYNHISSQLFISVTANALCPVIACNIRLLIKPPNRYEYIENKDIKSMILLYASLEYIEDLYSNLFELSSSTLTVDNY